MSEITKCKKCGGSGSTRAGACRICDGRGKVLVTTDPDGRKVISPVKSSRLCGVIVIALGCAPAPAPVEPLPKGLSVCGQASACPPTFSGVNVSIAPPPPVVRAGSSFQIVVAGGGEAICPPTKACSENFQGRAFADSVTVNDGTWWFVGAGGAVEGSFLAPTSQGRHTLTAKASVCLGCPESHAGCDCQETVATVSYVAVPNGDDDLGAPDCPEGVGEPVDVRTGNTYIEHIDVPAEDREIPGPAFARAYNSKLGSSSRFGLFGYGWTTALDQRVTPHTSGYSIALLRPDGRTVAFYSLDGIVFVPASFGLAPGERVVKDASGYTWRPRPQSREYARFDLAGRLLGWREGAATFTVARDAAGRPDRVVDQFGRFIALGYPDAYEPKVSSVSDAMGLVATFGYHPGWQTLALVIYAADQSEYRYSYDWERRLLEVRDARALLLERHAYDGRGRATLSEREGGAGRVTLRYDQRDADGDFTEVTDALGRVARFYIQKFCFAGRVGSPCTDEVSFRRVRKIVGVCPCGDRGREWEYDPSSALTVAVTDSLGRRSVIDYDGDGNAVRDVDFGGRETLRTFSPEGDVLSETADGQTWTFAYQATTGLPLSVAQAGRAVSLTRDANGCAKTLVAPTGKVWTLTPDTACRTTKIAPPSGGGPARNVVYNLRGQPTRLDVAGLSAVTIGWTGWAPTSVKLAGGQTWTWRVDNRGLVDQTTDPLGKIRTIIVDGARRLVDDGRLAYSYNLADQMETIANRRGGVWRIGRNGRGDVETLTWPSGAVERLSLDSEGRVIGWTARSGKVGAISLRADDLPESVDFDGERTTYAWADGRFTGSANDADSLVFSHNTWGELVGQTSQARGSVALGRDASGALTGITYEGVTVGYTRDAGGRVSKASYGALSWPVGYDSQGRRRTLTAPGSVATTTGYDSSGRLTSKITKKGAAVLASVAYVLNTLGGATKKTLATDAAYTETYTLACDGVACPLATVKRAATTESYAYDAARNRSLTGAPLAFDADNQIVSLDHRYEDGHLTRDSWREFEWRGDRLISVRRRSDLTVLAAYKYDGLGRMIDRTAAGVTTPIAWIGWVELKEGATRRIPGLDADEVLGLDRAGVVSAVHQDALMSVLKETSTAGAVTSTRHYSAYGVPQVGEALGLGWQGRWYDPVTKLAYHRHRWYDPTAGRWLSEDPLAFEGGENLYEAVGSEPTSVVDPYGLLPPLIVAAGAAGSPILVRFGPQILRWAQVQGGNIMIRAGPLAGRVAEWLTRQNRWVWGGREFFRVAGRCRITDGGAGTPYTYEVKRVAEIFNTLQLRDWLKWSGDNGRIPTLLTHPESWVHPDVVSAIEGLGGSIQKVLP